MFYLTLQCVYRVSTPIAIHSHRSKDEFALGSERVHDGLRVEGLRAVNYVVVRPELVGCKLKRAAVFEQRLKNGVSAGFASGFAQVSRCDFAGFAEVSQDSRGSYRGVSQGFAGHTLR